MPTRDELVPDAVGVEVTDLFVVCVAGPLTDGGHPVLWLAGEEIERWLDFGEYVRAMVIHAEREIDDVRAG